MKKIFILILSVKKDFLLKSLVTMIAAIIVNNLKAQSSLPVYNSDPNIPQVGWTYGAGIDVVSGNYDCGGYNVLRFNSTTSEFSYVYFNSAATNVSFFIQRSTNAAKTLVVEESSNNITYTTVATITNTQVLNNNTTYQLTYSLLSTTRYVRFTMTGNSGGNYTVDGIGIYNTTSPPCYCQPFFSTSTVYEYITNVNFAGINNSSTYESITGQYANYVGSNCGSVQIGITTTLSVTIKADANDYVYAWVDWNQNGNFTDAGEQYLLALNVNSNGPYALSITPPSSAVTGTTRMRIMVDYNNSTPSSCRSATFGEAEDYCLNVLPAAICSTPSLPSSVSLNTSTINSQAIIITPPATPPTGYFVVASTSSTLGASPVNGNSTYTVGSSFGGGIIEYFNTANSFTASSLLNSNTNYYYFIFSYNSGCTGQPYYSTTYYKVSSIAPNKYTCIASPMGLSSGSITANSASISWTPPNGTITSYDLKYSTVSNGPYTTIFNVTNPYVLTGLSASTTYYYVIVANNTANNSTCGPSASSSEASFGTACGAVNVPYTQNFDAVTAPAIPNCTLVQDVNSDGFTWKTSTASPNSSPNSLRYSFNSTAAANDWWFTPGINLTAGITYKISFTYKADLYFFSTYEGLEIKTGASQSAAGMTSSALFYNDNIVNTSYSPATIYYTATSTGVQYFGWHAISDINQYYLYVDDVSISTAPTCASNTNTLTTAPSFFTNTYYWSNPNNWSLGHVPLPCEDVVINSSLGDQGFLASGVDYNAIVNIDQPVTVRNLTINGNHSGYGDKFLFVQETGNLPIHITGSLNMSCNGGQSSADNEVKFLSSTTNLVIDGISTVGQTSDSKICLFGGEASSTSVITLNGDLILNKNAGAGGSGTWIFDKSGNQSITNNITNSILDCEFQTLQIGNVNSPIITLAGSSPTLTSINGGNFSVINNSSMVIPNTYTLNQIATSFTKQSINKYFEKNGVKKNYQSNSVQKIDSKALNVAAIGTLSVTNGAKLQLGGSTGGQPGSNFPKGFNTITLNPTSTVEYNGTAQQTIYATPDYGNLTISNSSPNGAIAGGNLNIVTDILIISGAKLSTNLTYNYPLTIGRNWTNNGSFNAYNGIVMFHSFQSGIISGSSPTAFYKLGLNKGSSIATILDISGTGVITQTAGFPLIDTSGLLRINSGASFSKTSTDLFTINSTAAGIQNNGGTFNTNGSVQNNGLFRNSSGSSIIGSLSGNELSTSGGSLFDMQDGILNITGRLVNTAGSYTMSGGIITLCTIGNALANTGSFNMSLSTMMNVTGGTVVFQYPSTQAATKYDLNILNSGTKNIIGGTFVFGNGSTPVSSTFQFYSDVPVYNITLNSTNDPSVMLTKDQTVNGTLALNGLSANGTFSLNGKTITLNGGATHANGTISASPTSNMLLNNSATKNLNFKIGSHTLHNIVINASATDVNLDDSLYVTGGSSFGTITVNGTLKTNGWLSMRSDANGDAIMGQSSSSTIINGNITVERYIPKTLRAWRFLSLPFKTGSTQTLNQAWQEGAMPYPQADNSPYVNNTMFNPKPGFGTEITFDNYTGNGFDVNITYKPSLKFWDYTAQNWSTYAPHTNSTLITDNYGAYCLFVRGDRSVNLIQGTSAGVTATTLRATGNLNENGGAAITPVSRSLTNNQYLFIGNPFASPVNFNLLQLASNINPNYFYVWDPKIGSTGNGVGAYVTYSTALGGSWSNNSGSYPLGKPPIIQSGQAFFMQANANGTASVTFPQSAKNTTEFSTQKQISKPILYIQLAVPEDSMKITDGDAVVFGNNFLSGRDEFDAPKMWNITESIALARDTNYFVVEARPMVKLTDTVFLRLYLYKDTAYSLKIFSANLLSGMPNMRAWIIDNYLNTKTEISLNDTTLYNFLPNTDTLSYRNRFMLVFNRQITTNPIPVTQVVNQNDPNITGIADNESTRKTVTLTPNPVTALKNAKLNFAGIAAGEYEIVIYSIKGDKLVSEKIQHDGSKTAYILPAGVALANGIYNVAVINNNGKQVASLKLIIGK